MLCLNSLQSAVRTLFFSRFLSFLRVDVHIISIVLGLRCCVVAKRGARCAVEQVRHCVRSHECDSELWSCCWLARWRLPAHGDQSRLPHAHVCNAKDFLKHNNQFVTVFRGGCFNTILDSRSDAAQVSRVCCRSRFGTSMVKTVRCSMHRLPS